MVEQCLADLANDLVGERPGEIDASDFGAERACEPLSEDRVVIHRASSSHSSVWADQPMVAIYELRLRGNSRGMHCLWDDATSKNYFLGHCLINVVDT